MVAYLRVVLVAALFNGLINLCRAEIVVPDTGNPGINRQQLELAIKAADPEILITSKTGLFAVDRPIFVFKVGRKAVRGDKKELNISGPGLNPTFIGGISATPSKFSTPNDGIGVTWNGDKLYDSFNILDTTLVNNRNVWTGLGTLAPNDPYPTTIYTWFNSGFTNPLGSYWSDLDSICIDVAFQSLEPFTGECQMFGSHDSFRPSPIGFWMAGTLENPIYQILIRTTPQLSDIPGPRRIDHLDKGIISYIQIPYIPDGNKLRRLSLYINLPNNQILAWYNGKQVDIIFPFPKDLTRERFVNPELEPFKIAGSGKGIDGWYDWSGKPVKQIYHALKYSTGDCPYSNDGPGTLQTNFKTKLPTTDAQRYQYLGNEQNLPLNHKCVAYIDGKTHKKDVRLVSAITKSPDSGYSYGLALLAGDHTHPYNSGARLELSKLTIGSTVYSHGSGILMAGSLVGNDFKDVMFRGGQDGFRQAISSVSYPNTFTECTFEGHRGTGLVTSFMTGHFYGNTQISSPARYGVNSYQSNLDFQSLFMQEGGLNLLANYKLNTGGNGDIARGMFDTEYTDSPLIAAIWAERGVDNPGTILLVNNTVIDVGASKVPMIFLDDKIKWNDEPTPRKTNKCYVNLKAVQTWKPGVVIKTNGPAWEGDVQGWLGGNPNRVHENIYGEPGLINGVVNQ